VKEIPLAPSQPTAGLISLGCAKNRIDSEQILALLQSAGWRITNAPEEAEVLIVNTCGFIQSAKEEAIQTLFEMAGYKTAGRCRLLVATGCLVQRYGAELRAQMPEVDAFLGVNDYPRLLEVLDGLSLPQERPLMNAPCGASGQLSVFEGRRVLTTGARSAYLRIADGCDNRCAYCAVPLIRGPYRSRTEDAVLREAEALAEQGVREVTLIAQDTTRFGDDLEGRPTLARLIRRVGEIGGVDWVRALYCYPTRVDDALLEALAAGGAVCPYLDIPLQHIDAGVLSAMGRRGTPEGYRAVLAKARALGLTLRTTFIVGFPGESADAFARLRDFVEEAAFDRMGAFAYSAEDGTSAAKLPNPVPEAVKAERLDALMRLQRRIAKTRGALRAGETAQVLCEGAAPGREGWYVGRSAREAPEIDGKILFHAASPLAAGEMVAVRMERARGYDLEGVRA
jgi:ribosomal protein S12 methylthiotransferase